MGGLASRTKAAVAAKLEKLVRLNRTRGDFAEKFEALIESYNNGSRNIEQLFEELLKLSNSLDAEQERHVRENLSEAELVIFDILTRPAPELSTAERDEVKKVAKALLERLKALLVLKWRQKSAARPASAWRDLVVPKRAPVPAAHSHAVPALHSSTAPNSSTRSHSSRSTWAELLRRVFALDVLTCPHCGGPRRPIAQLTDPVVVRRILAHLGHPTEPPRPAPTRSREQLDFA